jgi:hypothetical protein
MTQPGQISHGMPPRDNDVWRAIRDLQRKLDQQQAAMVKALSRLPSVMTVGTVPVTILAGDVKATKAVTFDTPFPAAPLVLAGSESAAYDGLANGFTTTGFTAIARHSDGTAVDSDTTVTVVWIAVRL